LCSAFATADLSTLRTTSAAAFGVKSSVASASATRLPRMVSATRRTFCGDIRM
jgi:hypothetical protein